MLKLGSRRVTRRQGEGGGEPARPYGTISMFSLVSEIPTEDLFFSSRHFFRLILSHALQCLEVYFPLVKSLRFLPERGCPFEQ